MKTKYQILSIIGILMIAGLACGQLQFGIENPKPLPSNEEVDIIDTPEPEPEIVPENTAVRDTSEEEDFSQLWVETEDPRTGLRFAIPCFWVVEMPPQQNNFAGLGSFSVNNFTQDFITSLGPKRSQTVWEIGGLKFDLGYHTMAEYGLSPTSSLEELAYALVNPDTEHGITSTESLEINGKMSLRVNTWGTFGEGSFYLMPYINNLNILFGPSDANHPDIQAILQSMALDSSAPVQLPTIHPADPPEGMAAPCMGQSQQPASSSDASPLSGTLDCNQVTDSDALMWVICNVQDSFRSRNTQPLLGYMGEPFKIGYWQSEGVDLTREEALREFENNLIPQDPSHMTFTLDESLFPPLFGMQPEQIFPPDANIVEVMYSEGWGQDGQGAALLYFSEKPNGGYYFYGILIGGQHFDK